MNHVIIIGNLTRDVETKDVNGTTLARFTVAVNWRSKDKEGADFIPVDVWGNQGDNCAKYLSKGSQVAVQGAIKTRSWEDDEGNRRYATSVRANRVKFLTTKSRSEEPAEEEVPSDPENEEDLPY